jgi:hypothetical protein
MSVLATPAGQESQRCRFWSWSALGVTLLLQDPSPTPAGHPADPASSGQAVGVHSESETACYPFGGILDPFGEREND